MLKFTNTIRKKIHAFNQYCLKLPSIEIEQASKKQKLKLVKDNWMLVSGEGLSSSALKYSVLDVIKADVGSSGFLAPKKVIKKLQSIDEGDLVEYSGNHVPDTLTKRLQRYCQEEDIIAKNSKISSDVLTDNSADTHMKYSIIGNGTHNLITVLFSTLIKQPGDVIVVTDPTYGLLLNGITNVGGNYKAFPLEKEDEFKPSPQKLKTFITEINDKLRTKFIVDLEINAQLLQTFISAQAKNELANLFTSLKRTLIEENTQASDEVVSQINKFVAANITSQKQFSKLFLEQYSLKNCPRVRGFLSINPQTPAGSVLEQNEINKIADAIKDIDDLTIIDDLTHKDIMLSNKKAGSFSASSASNKTVSLLSFSKSFGLAGVRAGVGIGPQSLIKPMTERIFDQQSMISTYAITALESVMDLKKSKRDKYLSENNEIYIFRRNLVDAIVHGIKSIKDKTLRKKIRTKVNTLENFKKSLKDFLLEGIKGLSLVNNPDGGFFVQLDFSQFKGKYLGTTQLNQSLHFHQAFDYLTDVHTIPNELNFHFNTPSLRFALTMTEAEICEALLRIKGILNLLSDHPKEMLKEKPAQTKTKIQSITKVPTIATNTKAHDAESKPKSKDKKESASMRTRSESQAFLINFNRKKNETTIQTKAKTKALSVEKHKKEELPIAQRKEKRKKATYSVFRTR
ncbi:aminotransferase class I/II-fold pyridoxal phosphate-dependent enzyme [Candidatus Berkiella cookevillensis]|uniref:Aminotransferase class I/II-fold pyridoxal phosphate-dependent enzyme n=1 Tax=Candidatus Berkiella cookevillensis TaxID=437022 RepID=A0A0Q9YJV4_9GAMM|nr:aminotransferase class I/II-fold pyridoxal phosphate-dependent enzyme [Candidatus Berkiella cookevillensis]MCS5708397.1 aminotransferase class I/II-fold pyridoxal phosphate-dependent enzyme [Candidatus Berkiella cookevillensis]